MDDVRVLTKPAAVEAALDPIRSAILEALADPGSAATVAEIVGLTRQKVNYHLKALESHGLVELVEERRWGGITERVLRRSARQLIASPEVLQRGVVDPDAVADRLSSDYLIAVNARTLAEVGAMVDATTPPTRIPTLTIDAVIGFASADDRAAFAAELQTAIAGLAARYHHDDGRPHRLTVTSYPQPKEQEPR